MKMDIRYYWTIFLRRLPYFLIVVTLISAASVIIALTLPPAYVSEMKLIIESPQIPDELAASTAQTPAQEQLQILEQLVLTRANLLEIADRQKVFEDLDRMTADRVVDAMRSHTSVEMSLGRSVLPLMHISFEASSGKTAAAVLNEYLTIIQKEDVEARTVRATQTQDFFEREVTRLSEELAERNAGILSFKTKNADTLPESLKYRINRQAYLQERLATLEREIASLKNQQENLVRIYKATGQVSGANDIDQLSSREQLEDLRRELNQALVVYSAENPYVQMLQTRIAQVEEEIRNRSEPEGQEDSTGNPLLDVQLAEIKTRIGVLEGQRSDAEAELAKVTDAIERTPATAIRLEALVLDRDNVQQQYNLAVDRLSQASTGERIEMTAHGQRVSVIEPPAVPTKPSKPNRLLIAGGGTVLGILLGVGLVVLLEMLNRKIWRPEDLVAHLGITPLATIPYVETPGEVWHRRGLRLGWVLVCLIGIPTMLYAIHVFYQPLDLVADQFMGKLGMRW